MKIWKMTYHNLFNDHKTIDNMEKFIFLSYLKDVYGNFRNYNNMSYKNVVLSNSWNSAALINTKPKWIETGK